MQIMILIQNYFIFLKIKRNDNAFLIILLLNLLGHFNCYIWMKFGLLNIIVKTIRISFFGRISFFCYLHPSFCKSSGTHSLWGGTQWTDRGIGTRRDRCSWPAWWTRSFWPQGQGHCCVCLPRPKFSREFKLLKELLNATNFVVKGQVYCMLDKLVVRRL